VSFPWSLVLDAMLLGLLPMLAIATVGWLYSIWADEVSIVSPLWPLMVLTSVFTYAIFFDSQVLIVASDHHCIICGSTTSTTRN
jgi:hypothetical protein